MDGDDCETAELAVTDPELRQILGMFDVPAFARRGQELEFALERLQGRLAHAREEMLAMVRLRLRQWFAAATSDGDGRELLSVSIDGLILATGEPAAWSRTPAPRRRRIAAARDLAASVERFNRRWSRFLDELKLDSINAMIANYNRYYLFEKECVFISSRVAAKGFRPRPPLTAESLREDHPLLPSPTD